MNAKEIKKKAIRMERYTHIDRGTWISYYLLKQAEQEASEQKEKEVPRTEEKVNVPKDNSSHLLGIGSNTSFLFLCRISSA